MHPPMQEQRSSPMREKLAQFFSKFPLHVSSEKPSRRVARALKWAIVLTLVNRERIQPTVFNQELATDGVIR